MKIAVITGADGGMGQVICTEIAKAGYCVIMACENIQKSEKIRDKIVQKSNSSSIELIEINLASLDSIDTFFYTLSTKFHQIDLLINNAGVLLHNTQNTIDGIEATAGINYLGHYYLTKKCLLLMNNGSRIINMASLSYKWFDITDAFLMPVDNKHFSRFNLYSASKRALVYFTLNEAESLKKRGITINCADPGIVNTGIIKMGNKIIDKLCDIFFRPIIYSPEKGASTLIYIALSENVSNITGSYFANKKESSIPEKIQNSPYRHKLEKITLEILQKLDKKIDQ